MSDLIQKEAREILGLTRIALGQYTAGADLVDKIAQALQRREDRIKELEAEMTERLKVSNDCIDVELMKNKYLQSLLSRCEEVLLPLATASGWILEDGKTLGETICFKAKELLSELKTSRGDK